MKRITHAAFVFSLSAILLGSLAAAQTASPTPAPDQPSLGDYARKVRKDPPAAAKSKPKVFDNDNLPMDDKLSVVGQKPDANAAPADDNNKDKNAAKPEDDQAKKQALWKEWQGKLTSQKDSIDLASRELDVLQREYQLRAAAMYALEDAKQKLTDMQEEARKAGVPSNMIPD